MKVAVVTNQEGQTGKSVLSLLLGLLFSATQDKESVILSTGDASSMYAQCNIGMAQGALNNTNIYNALMKNAALKGEEIIRYADRISTYNTYAFNLFNARLEEGQLRKLFEVTLAKVVSELAIVEIKGDLNSELNHYALMECGAIFYVFNPNKESIAKLQQYTREYDKNCVQRTIFICQNYPLNMVSENHFVKDIGIAKRSFIYLPYNEAVVKACYEGNVDSLIPSIIKGEPETITLRQKLLEMMQALFDTDRYKYIRGFAEWPRL